MIASLGAVAYLYGSDSEDDEVEMIKNKVPCKIEVDTEVPDQSDQSVGGTPRTPSPSLCESNHASSGDTDKPLADNLPSPPHGHDDNHT